MKSNLNLEYIKYKIFFITSAYYQEISENASKLFIICNNSNYFPEFILYHVSNYVGNDHLNRAVINIRRLSDIVFTIHSIN